MPADCVVDSFSLSIQKKPRKRKSLPASSINSVLPKSRASLPLFPGLVGLRRSLQDPQIYRSDASGQNSARENDNPQETKAKAQNAISLRQNGAQTSERTINPSPEPATNDPSMGQNISKLMHHVPPTIKPSCKSHHNHGLVESVDSGNVNFPCVSSPKTAKLRSSHDSVLEDEETRQMFNVPLSSKASLDYKHHSFEKFLGAIEPSGLFLSPEKTIQPTLLRKWAEESHDAADSPENPQFACQGTASQQPPVPIEPDEITGNTNVREDIATRNASGRISDDTAVLREFLKRVQLKKEAEVEGIAVGSEPILAESNETNSPPSPTPSGLPSQALDTLDMNSPSRTIIALSEPPEGIAEANGDLDELRSDVRPNRRSLRAHIIRRHRSQETPNIAVRHRPDGTNPVLLLNRASAEMAHLTKENTTRNQGQAMEVRAMLKMLKTRVPSPLKEHTARLDCARKGVDWDETLVYYQEDAGKQVKEVKAKKDKKGAGAKKGEVSENEGDEGEEIGTKDIKLKRSQGLGVVNGTPAPKRTGTKKEKTAHDEKDIDVSNDTGAPKKTATKKEKLVPRDESVSVVKETPAAKKTHAKKQKPNESEKDTDVADEIPTLKRSGAIKGKSTDGERKIACRIPTPRKTTRAATKDQSMGA